jgi:hypothetical protein
LDLSISSSSIGAGQPLIVQVDEYNPMPSSLNVTAGRSWALEGLRADQCYASVYPFDLALYQGVYTTRNASEAKPLQIFPLVPCPLLIRLVTGYYFNPDSSMAVVLPGTGPSIPMSANVTISGNVSEIGRRRRAQPLAPESILWLQGTNGEPCCFSISVSASPFLARSLRFRQSYHADGYHQRTKQQDHGDYPL